MIDAPGLLDVPVRMCWKPKRFELFRASRPDRISAARTCPSSPNSTLREITRHGPATTRYVRPLAGSLFLVWSLILGHAAPAAAQPVVQHGWEDGTLQGWTPFGGGVLLTNSTAAANSGSRSLLTTGRTAGFNGPSLEVGTLLAPGTTYQFTAFVRLAPGESATQVRMTMRRTPSGGSAVFEQVAANTAVTDAGWAMVQGDLQLRGQRLGAAALHRKLRAPRRRTTWTTSAFASARRRLQRPAGHVRHSLRFRDRHPRRLGAAHRPRDGRGHQRGRALAATTAC